MSKNKNNQLKIISEPTPVAETVSSERVRLSTKDVTQVCPDCKKQFTATRNEYSNGDIVITPPRCPRCQSVYFANIRLTKLDTAIRHLKPVAKRPHISKEEKQAVMNFVTAKFQDLLDTFVRYLDDNNTGEKRATKRIMLNITNL